MPLKDDEFEKALDNFPDEDEFWDTDVPIVKRIGPERVIDFYNGGPEGNHGGDIGEYGGVIITAYDNMEEYRRELHGHGEPRAIKQFSYDDILEAWDEFESIDETNIEQWMIDNAS